MEVYEFVRLPAGVVQGCVFTEQGKKMKKMQKWRVSDMYIHFISQDPHASLQCITAR